MINIVAILHVKNWQAFNEFEGQAIAILRSYGGELLSAFESEYSDSADAEDIEVHCIQFPDAESFKRYRNDPKLAELADLRSQAIDSTKVYVSRKLKEYA